MIDSAKPLFVPKKSRPSIVMLVGLQGSGKTTTCTKYAKYYHDKGFNPALICVDTLEVSAYTQLKMSAAVINIPVYGSETEHDPVKVACAGIEVFKSQNRDLIILDTTGCCKQDSVLFDALRKVAEAIKPNLVVLVWDCRVGQAFLKQASAFKEIGVGAVILTKMEGHAKGGSALNIVAATESPVIYIGTGTGVEHFAEFDGKKYISRLLGMEIVGSSSSKGARLLIASLMSEAFTAGRSAAVSEEDSNREIISQPPDILMTFFAHGWNFGISPEVSLPANAWLPVRAIQTAGYRAGLLAAALNDSSFAKSGNTEYQTLLISWTCAGLHCGSYLKNLGFEEKFEV